MKPDSQFNNSFFNSLSERIEQLTPPGLLHFRDEITEIVRSIVKEAMTKMELVTREEFDIQTAVLEKTQSKLKALEAKLTRLEETLSQPVAETIEE